MKSYDAIVIAALPEGFFLSQKLFKQGKNILWLNGSPSLPPEDLEGPFGCFQTNFMPLQASIPCHEGFCVITHSHSFHFKNTFLQSVYKKRKEYQELLQTLRGQKPKTLDFQTQWLSSLTQRLTLGVDLPMNKTSSSPIPPVTNSFQLLSVRHLPALPHHLVLKNHKKWTLRKEKSRFIFSFENTPIQSSNLILLLNPLTAVQRGLSSLFITPPPPPVWTWQRFSFTADLPSSLPPYMVLADPKNLPWTHEKLLCIKKSFIQKDLMHVWAKIPYKESFQLKARKKTAAKILSTLNHYFPKLKKESIPENEHLNNTLFPIYSEKSLSKIQLDSKVIDGWEAWDLSLNSYRSQENKIQQQIAGRI